MLLFYCPFIYFSLGCLFHSNLSIRSIVCAAYKRCYPAWCRQRHQILPESQFREAQRSWGKLSFDFMIVILLSKVMERKSSWIVSTNFSYQKPGILTVATVGGRSHIDRRRAAYITAMHPASTLHWPEALSPCNKLQQPIQTSFDTGWLS